METQQKTAYTQVIPDIPAFLKQRKEEISTLNSEAKALVEKMETMVKEHRVTILVTVPFTEVLTTFAKQQMVNFFPGLSLPEGGLFLKKVDFVHVERVSKENLRAPYQSDIRIGFSFNDERFNSFVILEKLGFNDEDQRVAEQVSSLGYDPHFVSPQKYKEVKDILREVRSNLLDLQEAVKEQ